MDTSLTPPPDRAVEGTDAHRLLRRDQLFSLARAATGFMPDDEGEALYFYIISYHELVIVQSDRVWRLGTAPEPAFG